MRHRPLRVAATLSVSIALGLAATGCRTRHDVGIELAPDGSGTFSIATGLDAAARKLVAASGDDPTAAFPADLTEAPRATRRVPWRSEGFEGVRLVTPFASLEELDEAFNGTQRSGPPLLVAGRDGHQIDFAFDGARFHAAAVAPALETFTTDPDLDEAPLAFEVRLRVRLPGRVTGHNADRVEPDGTLVWSLHPPRTDPAEATTRLPEAEAAPTPSRSSWTAEHPMAAAAGVAAAAAAAAAVVRHRRRKGPPHIDHPEMCH